MWCDHNYIEVKKKCAANIRKEMPTNVNSDYLTLAELWTVLIFLFAKFPYHKHSL